MKFKSFYFLLFLGMLSHVHTRKREQREALNFFKLFPVFIKPKSRIPNFFHIYISLSLFFSSFLHATSYIYIYICIYVSKFRLKWLCHIPQINTKFVESLFLKLFKEYFNDLKNWKKRISNGQIKLYVMFVSWTMYMSFISSW